MIDIVHLRMKKATHKVEHYIREFEDEYEYCLIKDYEMLFNDFKSQSIQVSDCFVTLLELRNKTILVSVLFPKAFDVDEIVEWIDTHTISYNDQDNRGYFVKKAGSIVEAVKFKGRPIVLATRGSKKIYYDIHPLIEITNCYVQYSQIVNTVNAKSIEIE
ncbi:hypothetical protein [Alkalihalobacterium alkalinitrilicum]|uniref:hypothetical protein n=1 Tax=Alkalihalobacterium alkalinitrilicum TaxID=427920 RepID=UPI00114DDC1F|nr:hypothetical protein [Alkalihalobacterium alkalinitrilicum]